MSTDWYTKLVLTVLAASAVFLAMQHFDEDASGGEARYRLQAIPMGRLLLRLDTETGRTWTAALGKPDVWREIAESPIDKAVDEETAAAEPEAPAPRPKEGRKLEVKKPEEPPAEGS